MLKVSGTMLFFSKRSKAFSKSKSYSKLCFFDSIKPNIYRLVVLMPLRFDSSPFLPLNYRSLRGRNAAMKIK